MDFLYYQPGEGKRPALLDYAFEQQPISHPIIANGPDGGSGIVWAGGCYHDRTNRVGVYHDRQTWKPYPGSNLWIGWYTAEPPTPADLARSRQIPGNSVILGDGRSWLIPTARSCVDTPTGELAGAITLPRKMELTPDRQWANGPVIDQYAELYRVAEGWWDFLMSAYADADGSSKTITLDKAEAADWCCIALQANYRVSAVEVWLLDLLSDLTRAELLNAVVDLDTWHRRLAAKKNNTSPSETLSTTVGHAA